MKNTWQLAIKAVMINMHYATQDHVIFTKKILICK